MAQAQKPDFVFRRNGRVHLNQQGASVQSTTGSQGVRISGNNVGYTMFRGSVKSTGYTIHSPVSPSLPLPCVTVCHHISSGPYQLFLPAMYLRDSLPVHPKYFHLLGYLNTSQRDSRFPCAPATTSALYCNIRCESMYMFQGTG